MSIMESRWGLVPDMGLTRSLKGLIGVDLAKELTLTARVLMEIMQKKSVL